MKNNRHNRKLVLEIRPDFLEDPAIRAGIEKNYPDLLPLQNLNDRAE